MGSHLDLPIYDTDAPHLSPLLANSQMVMKQQIYYLGFEVQGRKPNTK